MIQNFDKILANKKQLEVKSDISKLGIGESTQLLDANKVLELNELEDKNNKSLSPKGISMENLDLRNRQRMIIGASFQKGEQPREGEIRHWKDGTYKFEQGHWKKQNNKIEQKKEESGEIKAELYDKPDMEYPVYKVTINKKDYFIQRSDEMNSGSSWYGVEKTGNSWSIIRTNNKREEWLGETKKEAIDMLIHIYGEKEIIYNKGDKFNYKYNNKNYKVEIIEDEKNLVKVKLSDEIEIEDKEKNIHRIKVGTIFKIGKKALNSIE